MAFEPSADLAALAASPCCQALEAELAGCERRVQELVESAG